MGDASTKAILIGVGYLMTFSLLCAYFVPYVEADILGHNTTFQAWSYTPVPSGSYTNSTEENFLNPLYCTNKTACLNLPLEIRGYWDCDCTNGLYTSAAGENYAFLTPTTDELNVSWENRYTIENPDNQEFGVIVAFKDSLFPYSPPDLVQCKVITEGLELSFRSTILWVFTQEVTLDYVNWDTATQQGTYEITTKTAELPVLGTWCTVNNITMYVAQTFPDTNQYRGGVYTQHANVSVMYHSSLTEVRPATIGYEGTNPVMQFLSALIGGLVNVASFLWSILRVLFWQLPYEILPFELQAIFIGVPEALTFIAVMSRIMP